LTKSEPSIKKRGLRQKVEGSLLATGTALAALLVGLLALPLIALVVAASAEDLRGALEHERFLPALTLSLRTTITSLAFVSISGTPLAWWIAKSKSPGARLASLLISLPIVIPPAVLGVSLLEAFGRNGALSPLLSRFGLLIPFTEKAVVLAQIIVSAPFFVQAAAHAFRRVDPDMLLVARTLGASRVSVFLRVALPVSFPGLIVGATLAWARSLGEFGATLLFAGNRPGVTQTLPLAIYAALESDVGLAIVLSLLLLLTAGLLLLSLRFVPGTRDTTFGRISESR
jgi:molybdate transport system permease protein